MFERYTERGSAPADSRDARQLVERIGRELDALKTSL
jgi:hypothetical protein